MGESRTFKEENWLKRYAIPMNLAVDFSFSSFNHLREWTLSFYLNRYLQYCRTQCHPRLSESATTLLQNHYVKIRQVSWICFQLMYRNLFRPLDLIWLYWKLKMFETHCFFFPVSLDVLPELNLFGTICCHILLWMLIWCNDYSLRNNSLFIFWKINIQDMRQQANETGEAAAIPITVRQLEAIVRLSEALAKMKL